MFADLGSLIGNSDWICHSVEDYPFFCHSDFMWNQFWMISDGQKLPFSQFQRLWILILEKFHYWKCQKFPNVQNSLLFKWLKRQFLEIQNDQNCFHVKSELLKILKFPHCVFPIKLPRSLHVIGDHKCVSISERKSSTTFVMHDINVHYKTIQFFSYMLNVSYLLTFRWAFLLRKSPFLKSSMQAWWMAQ